MRLRRPFIALLTALFVIGVAAPASASGPWFVYMYRNGPGTGGAMDACVHVDLASGTPVDQARCIDEGRWWWYMEEVSAGKWKIYNARTRYCINVKGGSTANSTPIIQYACSNTARNNLWHLDRITNAGGLDWYRIRSDNGSNMCLNVKGASTATDQQVPLILYTCGVERGNDLFTWQPA